MAKKKPASKVRNAREGRNAGVRDSGSPPQSNAATSERAGVSDSSPVPAAKTFPIVGVGASAGGLEAFRKLLTALRTDTGMAFVLIQHMDPQHESVLTSLLQRATAMPVREVTEGMAVEPNHVYVIPPNRFMTIANGILALTPRTQQSFRNLPIDHFFRALADDLGSAAIGVILSGTASDGTQGLRAIKAQGGITFAQNEESAQYTSMPLSAIAAGCVDLVLPPEGISAELARINAHPYFRRVRQVEGSAPEGGDDGFRKISTLLRTTTGVDFRLYKPSTITRRVARRMALRKLDTLEQYSQLLIKDRNELKALYDDLFIHVTGFFRDRESLEALRQAVFAKIPARDETAHVRVWVPGCSSGEEVYTIAMLCFEQLGEGNHAIQIFGTDISDRAIEQARAGLYTEAVMADVSPERQRRFFRRTEGGFQIAKLLRDVCVFARHDLAKDPPFSKLDLISCRNVLIYMGPALQSRVIEIFHYALKPEGHLMLGKSESLLSYSNLFSIEDAKHKIFSRRRFTSTLHYGLGVMPRADTAKIPITIPAVAGFDSRREVERVLLDRYAPAALVVDSKLHIIHFQGNTSPFLLPATGEPSFHLLRMVRPDLVVDLRAAIHQVRREGVESRRTGIRFRRNGDMASVDIQVWPLKLRTDKELDFLVVFEATPKPVPADAKKPARSGAEGKERAQAEMGRRDRELASLREQLRALIQDHEASSEEMRAMNEEVLSSNEELQSTNEELETAKEELESSNEELTTLNDEMQKRNRELSQLTDDLSNLLTGVNIPILFLDADLRIRRFTPLAGKVLNLIASDAGRPLTDIASTLEGADLGELASRTIQQSRVIEQEVKDREGHWFTLRMRPYKTAGKKIDGVLVALLDIDAVKRSLDEAREARDFAEATVETVREPLLVFDTAFKVVRATGRFYETFGGSPEDTEGRVFFDLGGGQWNIPRLRTLLEELQPNDSGFENVEIEHDFPAFGHRFLVLNARQIRRPYGGAPLLLLAIEDVTQRNRSDLARLSAATEDEQRRVARELHDDLVQRLGGLGMDLGSYAAGPEVSSPRLKKELRAFQARAVEAAEVGRRMAYQLHPSELEDLGLEPALRALCETVGEGQGLAVQFTARNLPQALPKEVVSCLYRVAQESIRNVVKHAKTKRAAVTIEAAADLIRLCVEDQGVGFSLGSLAASPGLGAVSMRERVQLANGKFSIASAPGKGTRVSAEIPLPGMAR